MLPYTEPDEKILSEFDIILYDNNNVKSVCEGTNKKNDERYYYERKQNVGDYHGQAPYLWCAVALLE